MRTTITLDDHLLARLKKRASESGTSVSSLIERAVRILLQTPAPSRHNESFKLVTFGKGGHFTRLNVDKTSALLEDDDVERFAKPR